MYTQYIKWLIYYEDILLIALLCSFCLSVCLSPTPSIYIYIYI